MVLSKFTVAGGLLLLATAVVLQLLILLKLSALPTEPVSVSIDSINLSGRQKPRGENDSIPVSIKGIDTSDTMEVRIQP